VIYGREVKLVEAARCLMRWRLMAIWRAPTWLHLLALPDFLNIVRVAIEKENLSGIYNLCDDQPLLLQDFLDRLARHWGYRPPRRLPEYFFHAAAAICEATASVCRTGTPLTRDMIAMGITSVAADTSRMKREIVGQLLYPTLRQGIAIL
jgi:NAD dependent epimerase/dehydratase family enzyme